MKATTYYTTILLLSFLGCISSLLANGNSDVNNFSEEFILSQTSSLKHSSALSRTAVLTGSGCSINITKVGSHNDTNNDGLIQAGETITYTFTVCNDGSEDLFNITINDSLSPVSGSLAQLSSMTGSGTGMCDATTFSTIYSVNDIDADLGFVNNSATVQAFDTFGNIISATSNTVTMTVAPTPIVIENPAITITKSSQFNDENNDGYAQVGETISYSFVVCNTGDTDLSNITINDQLVPVNGTISLTKPNTGVSCNNNSLSATYAINSTDITNGFVNNIATVSGESPGGQTTFATSNQTITTLQQITSTNPSISVSKLGVFNDENNDGYAQVGESISYQFQICNTGDVDIFDLTISDLLVNVPGSIDVLSVPTGQGTSCDNTTLYATYYINSTDRINGQVVNIATASGKDPHGNNISEISNTSVTTFLTEDQGGGSTADPSITLSKSSSFNDENSNGYAEVGETITYSFQVCNTGDEVVNNISIFDQLAPVSQTISSIGLQECSNILTSTYTIGQNDLINGQIINIATVTGTSSSSIFVADTSDDPDDLTNFDSNGDGEGDDPTITILTEDTSVVNASLELEKVGTLNDENNDGYAQVGETILYTFKVCNNSNEDVFDIVVADPLVTVTGASIDLIVSTGSGTSCDATTFKALYTITQNDITNGQVTNVAFARGQDRNGNIIIDFSDDPNNPNDFDQNGDDNPDDPTVLAISSEPIEELGSLGNYVWEDLNGNGIQDFGEPGIEGVGVLLYNQYDNLVGITYSDISGFYIFENLSSGQYYLKFGELDGYELTFSNTGGSDLGDSDVDGSNGAGTTVQTTLAPGENDLSWDAGYYRCIPLGEQVWYDVNQNSIFDSIENGINGVKVEVYRLDKGKYELYDIQISGHKPGTPSDDGYWKMCVPPGIYYAKFIIPPFGLVTASANIGSDDTKDSDVTQSFGPGTTNSFLLNSGDDKCDLGAGYYPQATLGDRVWYDVNRNGRQEVNEPGAGGIEVKIFDQQGSKVSNLITEADGSYNAGYLRDSEYYIEVVPPHGYTATLSNATTDDLDSDIDNTFGANTSAAFRTQPGVHTPSVDAGLISSIILAADWLSIDVIRDRKTNLINWTVAEDRDVKIYSIERKTGEFGKFEEISKTTSLNQEGIMNYQYVDNDSNSDGAYFYRVKMEMFDESFNYSDIVYINVTEELTQNSALSIYPNPATENVTLTINVSEENRTLSMKIVNELGQIVLNNEKFAKNIAKGSYKFGLDVSNYARGTYIIEIFDGSVQSTHKMVLVD